MWKRFIPCAKLCGFLDIVIDVLDLLGKCCVFEFRLGPKRMKIRSLVVDNEYDLAKVETKNDLNISLFRVL